MGTVKSQTIILLHSLSSSNSLTYMIPVFKIWLSDNVVYQAYFWSTVKMVYLG